MHILPAIPQDHEALTKLTKASKAYWGFEPGVLEKWSDELTITSEYIAENFVYKLLSEKQLIGYYSYFEEGPKIAIDEAFRVIKANGYFLCMVPEYSLLRKILHFWRMLKAGYPFRANKNDLFCDKQGKDKYKNTEAFKREKEKDL